MKQLLLTLSILFLLGQSYDSYSQTTKKVEEGVSEVLNALSTGSANFTDLQGALNDLKTKAQAEFDKEQAAIDSEKARLDRTQAELDKDKDREAQMMYDEWVARSKANTKMMQAREVLHERELKLAMDKVILKDRLKQAEQKLLSTLAGELKKQLDYHNSRMELLKRQLKEVEEMKSKTLKENQP